MFIFRYKKSTIMNEGIQFGVDLINDVSGFNYDKNSLNFKKNKVSKVLHHMKEHQTLCR